MIYLKDKAVKPYLGNYKPLNVYKGNTKIAGWKNSTKTGVNSVALENTYNANMGVKVTGKATQATRSGNNLCPNINSDKWVLSNGAYRDDNGYIVLPNVNSNAAIDVEWNGTTGTDGYYGIYWGFYLNAEVSGNKPLVGTVYLDENKNVLTDNGALVSRSADIEYWFNFWFRYNESSVYGTAIRDAKYVRFIIKKSSSAVSEFKFKNPQVSKTVATTYEPYGAMPSPEYPSEIQTSNLSEIKVEPINLWKQPQDLDLRDTKPGSGISYEVNNLITLQQYSGNSLGAYFKDNDIILDTTKSYLTPIILKNLKPNTNYTLSYFLETNATLYIYGTLLATGMVVPNKFNKQFLVNFITDANGENTNKLIHMNNNESPEIKYKDIILVEGTYTSETMPKFIPYFQPLTYPITPTNGFPSLPNGTADRIEVVDGVQSYVQRVGKYVFNGTENTALYYKYGDGYNMFRFNSNILNNVKIPGSNEINMLSNKFNVDKDFYWSIHKVKMWLSGNTYICMYLSNDNFSTLETFKTWLATQYAEGNPLIVYYELATPIITPITKMKTLPQYCSINLQADMDLDLEVSYLEVED